MKIQGSHVPWSFGHSTQEPCTLRLAQSTVTRNRVRAVRVRTYQSPLAMVHMNRASRGWGSMVTRNPARVARVCVNLGPLAMVPMNHASRGWRNRRSQGTVHGHPGFAHTLVLWPRSPRTVHIEARRINGHWEPCKGRKGLHEPWSIGHGCHERSKLRLGESTVTRNYVRTERVCTDHGQVASVQENRPLL
jgi:hypothetical protein